MIAGAAEAGTNPATISPNPDLIAAEIVEDLQAALNELALIARDMKK